MEFYNTWPFVSGFCFSWAQNNEGTKESLGERKAGEALRDWEGQRQTYLASYCSPRSPLLCLAVKVQPCCCGLTRPGTGICARHLNVESRPGAPSDPRSAWAAGAWEAIFQAGRVQLDAMRCWSLYGTTEPRYRNGTCPNIHRKGKPDWPGCGLWKSREATHVCRQRAAWVIKSLPRKILFEH